VAYGLTIDIKYQWHRMTLDDVTSADPRYLCGSWASWLVCERFCSCLIYLRGRSSEATSDKYSVRVRSSMEGSVYADVYHTRFRYLRGRSSEVTSDKYSVRVRLARLWKILSLFVSYILVRTVLWIEFWHVQRVCTLEYGRLCGCWRLTHTIQILARTVLWSDMWQVQRAWTSPV